MSLIKNSIWSAATAIATALGRFALMALVARNCQTAEVGKYIFTMWVVEISYMVAVLGRNYFSSRFFAEYSHDDSALKKVYKIWSIDVGGVSLLSALISVSVYKFNGYGESFRDCFIVFFWAAFSSIWLMSVAAQVGMRRFKNIFISNFFWAISAIVLVAININNLSHTVLLLIMLVSAMIAASISLINCFGFSKKLKNTVTNTDVSRFWKYSINVWISALLWNLAWSRGEFPLIKSLIGDIALAEYGVAYTVFGGATQAIMLLVGAVLPTITSLWGRGEKEKVINLIRVVAEIQVFVCALSATFFFVFSDVVVLKIFGEKYIEAGSLLPFFSFGLIALSFSTSNHLLQNITSGVATRNTVIATLAVLYIAVYIAIPYGIACVANSRAVALLIFSVISLTYFNKYFVHEKLNGFLYFKGFCFMLIVYALTRTWKTFYSSGDNLGWLVIVFLLHFVLSLFVFSISGKKMVSVFFTKDGVRTLLQDIKGRQA